MSWLEKLLPPKIQHTDPADRRSVPEGLWIKCPSCDSVLYKTDLEQNQNVCPTCGHHHRIDARTRLNLFLDNEGRFEIGQEVLPVDALKFKDSRKYPSASRKPWKPPARPTPSSSWAVPCTASAWWRPASSSVSWAAAWVRWWASASCAASRPPSSRRCPSSASPPLAAPACRKACSR